MNAESGDHPSTESTTSSPVDMAVGDEELTTPTKIPDILATPHSTGILTSDTASLYTGGGAGDHDTSGLVTMETVMPSGEGGEIVGGMSQHNGLPGYSPPRERQDSETTLDIREPGLVGPEEEDDEEEEDR